MITTKINQVQKVSDPVLQIQTLFVHIHVHYTHCTSSSILTKIFIAIINISFTMFSSPAHLTLTHKAIDLVLQNMNIIIILWFCCYELLKHCFYIFHSLKSVHTPSILGCDDFICNIVYSLMS